MTQTRDGIHPRRPPSSRRGEDSRERTILWDGVKRVSTSITRFGKNGRNYPERTDFNFGKKIENEWFEYADETGCSQGRCKKHMTNLEEEDVGTVPNLPRLTTEMVFFGDDDYQPDCPWKNSVDERGDDNTNEWEETKSHGESLRINWVSLDSNMTMV